MLAGSGAGRRAAPPRTSIWTLPCAKRLDLAIQFRQSILQHAAVAGFRDRLKLFYNAGTRQLQSFQLTVLGKLLGSQALPRAVRFLESLGLLRLDRFALPSAGH